MIKKLYGGLKKPDKKYLLKIRNDKESTQSGA